MKFLCKWVAFSPGHEWNNLKWKFQVPNTAQFNVSESSKAQHLNDSNHKLQQQRLYLTEKLKLDNYRPNVADIVKSVKTFQWNELALRWSLKWSEQIRRPTLPFSDPLNWMKWRNAHPPQENRWLALTTGGPAGPKLFRLWEIVKGKPSEICTYSLLAASYCFKRQFPKKSLAAGSRSLSPAVWAHGERVCFSQSPLAGVRGLINLGRPLSL